ncbi:MAG TPA: MBL fold metallo-hydrolase [Casimicrobiaceae bacterium]|nr:MBL fold metallo-hydrolase [Casimicrobiaceae bacterium]
MNASLPAAVHSLSYPWSAAPASGSAQEVVRGVWWLKMPLPFALDHVNLWPCQDRDGWVQIDTGLGNAATRALWEKHFRTTLHGRPLHRVIATHYHPDHAGNAAWLAGRWACPVAMAEAEYLTAHAVAEERAGYGTEATCALFRSHGLEDSDLEALAARGNGYRRHVPELPLRHERLLADDEIDIGEHRWRVLPGHGHSPEHAALYCAELGVLISGDMLLPKISTNVSVWPSDPDGDPLRLFLASLERFERLPAHTLVLPSHGLPFVGIRPRVEALRAHHAARLAEVEAAADQAPVTARDILPLLFRRPLDAQQQLFAMGEAIAHLNHLWHAGHLERDALAGIFHFRRA